MQRLRVRFNLASVFGILALVIIAFLVWGILTVTLGPNKDYFSFLGGQKKKMTAVEAEEIFATKFKDFTHAAKLEDRTGFANGPFKLAYPLLTLGEAVVDITDFKVEGADTLVLPDGTKIRLFAVSESRRNRFA